MLDSIKHVKRQQFIACIPEGAWALIEGLNLFMSRVAQMFTMGKKRAK